MLGLTSIFERKTVYLVLQRATKILKFHTTNAQRMKAFFLLISVHSAGNIYN